MLLTAAPLYACGFSRSCWCHAPCHQSNAKQLWANTKPMDAEARMVTQAAATKGANPEGHVWVYRWVCSAGCSPRVGD
jgi:hypothetical protein